MKTSIAKPVAASAQAGTLSQTTTLVNAIGKVRSRPTHAGEVSRLVFIAACDAMLGCGLALFNRYCKDGGIKLMRMNIDDLVRHPLGHNESSI
jgi:hypothetical protein